MLENSISTPPLDWVAPIRPVRKNRSVEEKRKIVLESLSATTSIAAVAWTHNINPNLLHTWRWQYRRGELGERDCSASSLIPVRIEPRTSTAVNTTTAISKSSEGYLEIIVGDARVLVRGLVQSEIIHAVLQALPR